MLDPFTLQAGHQFSAATLVVTVAEVRHYLAAVGDAADLYRAASAPVPPLFLMARGLRLLMTELDVRPGSVHGGQEVDCLRAVAVDQPLRYEARVARAATRQGARFLVLDVTINDDHGAACRGRATLLIPEAGGVVTG